MEISSLISQLTQNNEAVAKMEPWNTCVRTSDLIIELSKTEEELNVSISNSSEEVTKLEESLQNDSEQGKLLQEIKRLRNAISNGKQQNQVLLNQIEEANQGIKQLEVSLEPIVAGTDDIEKRTNDCIQAIARLEVENKKKVLDSEASREALDDLTLKYSNLTIQEERLIPQLLVLRQKEADIRNDMDNNPAPQGGEVLLDKYKAPIPRTGSAAIEVEADADDDDDDQYAQMKIKDLLQKVRAGSAQKRHSGPVTCLCFANNQPFYASGGDDSIVNVIRSDDYTKAAGLPEAKATIMSIEFSPNDSLLLTASYDKSVRLYKVPSFTLAHNIGDNRDCVNDARFAGLDKFVTCCRDQTIKLFDIDKSVPISSFTSNSTPYSIAVLNGPSLVVTAHHDGKLRAWDFRVKTALLEIQVHKTNIMQVLPFPNDTNRVISLGADRQIIVTDIRAKTILNKINTHMVGLPTEHMQMGTFENSCIVGGTSGDIFDFDIESGCLKKQIRGHTAPIFCTTIKQRVGSILTGDKIGNVLLWNV